MVFELRPIRLDVKFPIPDPSLVFVEREIVGLGFVDQTTPLEVTGEPPSDGILPLETEEFGLISVITLVEMVGKLEIHVIFPSLSMVSV